MFNLCLTKIVLTNKMSIDSNLCQTYYYKTMTIVIYYVFQPYIYIYIYIYISVFAKNIT